MRKLFFIICFIISVSQAKATVCVDRTFKEEHLNLYLCQNYSSFRETLGLLYQARAKVLNDYIAEKISRGELKEKRFEIAIYDQNTTSPRMEISQGQNGYFVDVSGYLSLDELIALVDYFASSEWKPLFTPSYEESDYSERSIRIKERFFEKYKPRNRQETDPVEVWSSGDIKLIYSSDQLSYFWDNTKLNTDTDTNLPVQIKDRYIFFSNSRIVVYTDKKVIKTLDISDSSFSEDLTVEPYDNWVNIGWSADNWLYSYSYDKNRFYKLETK
ncbi:hypothetical protein [Dysgonomonas macrotermitis]|uniref:Uncharacterized protein n=1 Tax=Dysgonomonas macrotermitis TaxID=1346286 RepID=A0A1M4T1J1_9BACT|nr:hypothetical protein [Dysgonomonas macrotermitis]SHE38348.1 hypothetical protein SAMN05444362_101212 [Dysgonomonas macrotermitis]